MRKLILGLGFCFACFLVAILIFSKGRTCSEEELYYTIPKIYSYQFEKDKKMKFSIYSNMEHSLLSFSEKNSYSLLCNGNTYLLKDVHIEKIKDCVLENEVFYKYILQIPILSFSNSTLSLENSYLEIKNEHFILNCFLGDIYIYNDSYFSLAFFDLYGNYAYREKELHFIGFTISLSKSYTSLEGISIGNAYSPLEYIEQDQLYDSERKINKFPYRFISSKPCLSPYSLTAKEGYYYIPIAYERLYLIQEACIILQIDGKKYAISDFLFLANEISLKDYPNIKEKGIIKNA